MSTKKYVGLANQCYRPLSDPSFIFYFLKNLMVDLIKILSALTMLYQPLPNTG